MNTITIPDNSVGPRGAGDSSVAGDRRITAGGDLRNIAKPGNLANSGSPGLTGPGSGPTRHGLAVSEYNRGFDVSPETGAISRGPLAGYAPANPMLAYLAPKAQGAARPAGAPVQPGWRVPTSGEIDRAIAQTTLKGLAAKVAHGKIQSAIDDIPKYAMKTMSSKDRVEVLPGLPGEKDPDKDFPAFTLKIYHQDGSLGHFIVSPFKAMPVQEIDEVVAAAESVPPDVRKLARYASAHRWSDRKDDLKDLAKGEESPAAKRLLLQTAAAVEHGKLPPDWKK